MSLKRRPTDACDGPELTTRSNLGICIAGVQKRAHLMSAAIFVTDKKELFRHCLPCNVMGRKVKGQIRPGDLQSEHTHTHKHTPQPLRNSATSNKFKEAMGKDRKLTDSRWSAVAFDSV